MSRLNVTHSLVTHVTHSLPRPNVSTLDSCHHVQVCVCCSVLQCVAACCSVVVCCSVLQCVAVCCSVSLPMTRVRTRRCVCVACMFHLDSETHEHEDRHRHRDTDTDTDTDTETETETLTQPQTMPLTQRARQGTVCCSELQCVAVSCSVLQ